jgi:NAD(P)-dependent dehydrogenase (short-subunit alcohol dehydrogenase family)
LADGTPRRACCPAAAQVIGKEYAETGITCNAVAPAVVRTAMVDAMPEDQVKYMTGAALGPLGRVVVARRSAAA